MKPDQSLELANALAAAARIALAQARAGRAPAPNRGEWATLTVTFRESLEDEGVLLLAPPQFVKEAGPGNVRDGVRVEDGRVTRARL